MRDILFDLQVTVLLDHIFPFLALEDIESLRHVCKGLKAIIDDYEWDRRYLRDFPHDSVRIAGNGMGRYKSRFLARLYPTIFTGNGRTPARTHRLRNTLNRSWSPGIVDFATFRMSGRYPGSTERLYDPNGVIIRPLDDLLHIETDEKMSLDFPIWDVCELRVCEGEQFSFLIRDILYGEPVELNMRCMCTVPPCVEQPEYYAGWNADPYLREDNISDWLLKGRCSAWNSPDEVRLSQPSPWQHYQDARRCENPDEELKQHAPDKPSYEQAPDLLMHALMEALPGCPDTMHSPRRWFGAASVGNVVYGIRNAQSMLDDDYEPTFKVQSFAFGAKIKRIGSVDLGNLVYNLFVLDEEGNFYGNFYKTSPFDLIEPTEPALLARNVADMADYTLLMKNGTIRCLDSRTKRWETIPAKAVLISGAAYLQPWEDSNSQDRTR